MMNTQLQIAKICDDIKHLLLSKNEKYGDSALNPCRIFSQASTVEQLLVRIDDKLNRIQKGAGLLASDEDVINDLIGYLVLLKIALEKTQQHDSQIYQAVLDDDKWHGEDLEPIYRNNVEAYKKTATQIDKKWLSVQLLGHRASE